MPNYFDSNKNTGFNINSVPAPAYFKDYLSYIAVVENLAPRTVQNYYTSVLLFLKWTQARDLPDQNVDGIDVLKVPFENVEQTTAQDIYEFLVYCDSDRQCGAASRAAKLSALKSFFRYNCEVAGRIDKDPARDIKPPKQGKPLPKYLTEEESVRLLQAARQGEMPSRDHCIVTLFLNCGMRLTELTGINLSDIRGDTLILRGKGRKERVVYLNKACRAALDEWLADRALIKIEKEDRDALFVSKRQRRRITGRNVEQRIEKIFLAAGLENRGFSPHKLRHTAATLMYKSGSAGVLELQEILGHASTQIVSRYAHVDSEQIRNSMDSFVLEDDKKEEP